MKRRNFLAALTALTTLPAWLKGTPSKQKVTKTHDARRGQTVVLYRNAGSVEQPDPNTYRFYENGWNPNAFEIQKSERLDGGKIKLYLSDTDKHNTITRGMMAVFQDEEVGFVSGVARGFPRDFQCIVTVTPLNWKS